MMENKELGIKISESDDETYWTETKEKATNAIVIEKRNILINQAIIELCEQELA